ncbi:unnamed protein product [Paramecium octaurelia]|uniref:Uncharacterized protein n=1 Tax=Paramecium octaurelia TaxID=43137 RepID=A0A8S1XPK6_PAROT|nr:unnamed protein product [Paramecium octaurelia]
MQQQYQDAEYFRKKDECRLRSFKRLKDQIENKCNIVKGRSREITVKKKLKPYKSLETKFQEHSDTFRTRFVNSQFSNIINEVSHTCEDIVSSISRIKNEDRQRNRDIQALLKKIDNPSELNITRWQTDSKYIEIKEELIKMQQEQGLPDYCKFCLINSKDSMKRMNRSNQEIKETRLLFQMKDKLTPNQLKKYMEQLLKKYQRIQQNQELEPNGVGWKLKTKLQPYQSSDDWVVIREHMLEKKQPSMQDKMKKAEKTFKRHLHEQKYRDAAFKQLKSQNEAILQFEKRVFKTEPEEDLKEQFQIRLQDAKWFCEENAKKIDNCKTDLKQQLYQIKREHDRIYKNENNYINRLLSS